MNIIFNILFFIGGYFVSALACSQILIILRVALPITFQIKKETPQNRILPVCLRLLFTLIFWLIACTVIAYLILTFTKRIEAYIIGFLIGFLMTIPETGKNPNNIDDFLRAYARFF